jgi:hypothetical protein
LRWTCKSTRELARALTQAGHPVGERPFGRWREVFGDDVVAAAMIDRLVHHAEVISLKGDSYRLRNRDLGPVPTTKHTTPEQPTLTYPDLRQNPHAVLPR